MCIECGCFGSLRSHACDGGEMGMERGYEYAANEYFLGYTGTGKTATLPYVWRWKKARVVNSTTYTDGVTIT